ncbi:EIN3-binding F-box protein 1 [Cryptomeria japonica]|uniref:EIN3-binding F-box protein 1 n=1 Tax=Cryptomeria japonica TaxID=3369 RepID=UPI0025AD568B|nr:EIN3-binding F-box protein 1 [Cryptomeria japonica]
MDKLSDDEVGLILKRVTDRAERKTCSQVCRQWRRVEGPTRTVLKVLDPQLLHSFLPRYPNLLILEAGRGITDSDLELIADTCPSLQVLNLNLRQTVSFLEAFEESDMETVTDEGICAIAAGCRDLRRVYLRRRNGVGNVGATALIKSSSNLTHLDLSWCHGITDQALEAMGAASSLQVLILHGCTLVTDWGLASLATGSSARTLKRLDLRECDQITDFGVSLLQQLSCLQVLNLAECGPRVTDTGGVALGAVSSLESLNFSWLINISDVSLLAVAENCHNLKEINVTGCELITGFGVRSFARHKSLQVLILASCYNVYSDDIEQTVHECPTLLYLGLDKGLRRWIPDALLERIQGRCRIEWL